MSDSPFRPADDVAAYTRSESAAPSGIWEPLIAVVLAAAWLGFLMWPGVVLFPGGAMRQSAPPAQLPAMPQANPPSTTPTARPRATEPAIPNGSASPHAETPAGGPTTARLEAGALADMVDNSVVMIAGTDASGAASGGTGFFVSPNLIVTNRHVIDRLDPNSIKVASKRLQPSQRPRVVAKSPVGAPDQVPDFALLSVDQVSRGFLKLGPSPSKLTPIVAASYPDYLLDLDSVISQGVINQKPELLPVKMLAHSARLGKGGAGGPILDLCGRVVGVNTAAKDTSEGTAILAQDITEVKAFLAANNVSVTADDAACPADSAAAPSTAGR
jgi:S1-C subfamily serine protease